MASSTLLGDRRCQARKSGMTVLGKVPKPINLPSQRLENHCQDPNAELVPKGTLSWGNHPSLTTCNTWRSSALPSPNTDGSTGSPGYLSDRPSSAGSFPRPSTAGSDRFHRTVSNAWGSNSRPSSASGILPARRAHSAETRPCSSQLSEPGAKNSAWGASRNEDKLGPASKFNSFTFSSGDFPKLGSEKNYVTNMVQQASGTVAPQKETMVLTPTDCLDKGSVNTWKEDNFPSSGGALPPDTQQVEPNPNASERPQQFNAQMGPPDRSCNDGVWYRDVPPGDWHRQGSHPGNYPIESCVFYPQILARPFLNSLAGARHGSLLDGHDPKNGQPRPPDPYMTTNHPVEPLRPVYGSCYGSPPTFGDINERNSPMLAMAPRLSLYNQYLNQNPSLDPVNFPAMCHHYAPHVANGQVESGHAHDSHGPQYNVLLKQHNSCKDDEEKENKDLSVTASVTEMNRKDRLGAVKPAQMDGVKDDPAKIGINDDLSSQPAKGLEVCSSTPSIQKIAVVSNKSQTIGDECTSTACQAEDPQCTVKKNATLIEKIEGLNSKAWLADGHCLNPASAGEEEKTNLETVNVTAFPSKMAHTSTILSEKPSEEVSFCGSFSHGVGAGESNLKSSMDVHSSAVGLVGPQEVELATDSHSHRRLVDYGLKQRFDSQEGELLRMKSPGKDLLAISSIENCADMSVQDCQLSQDTSEKKELHHGAPKVGDEPYLLSSMAPVDCKAQHAQMKEKATERAKQLQKEEEQTRGQKAKALAKLEELNRRTLIESSNNILYQASVPANQAHPKQDARVCPGAEVNDMVSDMPGSVSGSYSDVVVQTNADIVDTLLFPTISRAKERATMLEQSIDLSSNAVTMSVIHNELPVIVMQDAMKTVDAVQKSGLQFHDKIVSKQKLMSYRKWQNNSETKHEFEKNVSVGVADGLNNLAESAAPNISGGGAIFNNSKDIDESSFQHKNRNNRHTKNKSKSDEAPLVTTLQSLQKEEDKVPSECGQPKPSEVMMEDAQVLSQTPSKFIGSRGSTDVVTESLSGGLSQESTVDAANKAMEQWKPKHSRRTTKNLEGTKSVDLLYRTQAVVWAPVRSTNKKEPSEEVQSHTSDANSNFSRYGSNAQPNPKSKRAEMERYVPKPVVKEHSLQGNQKQLCYPSLAASGLNIEVGCQGAAESGLDDSVTLKVGLPSEAKYGENNKPNRRGSVHMLWRPRPTESAPVLLGFLEDSSADSTKDNQKSCYLRHPSKHDNVSKDQVKCSPDACNADTDYLMHSDPTTAPTVRKDHALADQGRRQPFKGSKVVGDNYSPRSKESVIGRTDKLGSQTLVIQAHESAERKSLRNEIQCVRDYPRSHWQPKLGAYSRHNEHKMTSGSAQSEVTVSTEIGTGKQIKDKRGTRVGEDSNGQSQNLNQDSSTVAELAPQDVKPQQELFLAGPRQHGLHGGQFNRGHETNFGKARGLQQDAAKQNLHSNVDRRKHNSHYEYQRVGYYNTQSGFSSHESVAGEEAQNCSNYLERQREQSQNRSRRGNNFYSQTSGATARAGGAYGSDG